MNKARFFRAFLIMVILMSSISITIMIAFLNFGLYGGQDASDDVYAIKNGIIFDGTGKIWNDAILIVESGEITCMGSDCEIPTEAEIIDAKGKSILPGLIDLHVHFYAPSKENADLSIPRQLLDYIRQRPEVRKNLHLAGVTGIRSLGDITDNILNLSLKINSGELAGPTVYAAGPLFTAPNGHPVGTIYKGNDYLIENATVQVTDPTIARQEVIKLAGAGVKGIKAVYDDGNGKHPKLAPEVLRAILDEAQQQGLWTAVHTGTTLDVQQAAQWGATTVEHGSREAWDSLTIAILLEKGTTVVPTISVIAAYSKNKEVISLVKSELARLDSNQVLIGAGTDTQGNMAFRTSLHRELELMVESGISPSKALQGATNLAARCLNIDHEVGTLSAGRRADLIIVDGKPWEQIADIQRIDAVMQGGNWVVKAGEIRD